MELTAKEKLAYSLYLEGMANEVIHICQQARKRRKYAIMDNVHIGLVQSTSNKLTSAIYMFVDRIKERVRIVNFSPNPLPDVEPESFEFKHLGKTFDFDLYMEKA